MMMDLRSHTNSGATYVISSLPMKTTNLFGDGGVTRIDDPLSGPTITLLHRLIPSSIRHGAIKEHNNYFEFGIYM